MPGDEHDVLAAQAELGQEALHGLEHGVVTAPGAPADLLVGGVLLAGLRLVVGGHELDAGAQPGQREAHWSVGHDSASSAVGTVRSTSMPSASATRPPMASASSAALSGMPLTWL